MMNGCRVNVYNHCSSYFADVVWTGLSTQHIRQGIEDHISLDSLRSVWSAISPVNYMNEYARWPKRTKFIYASYRHDVPARIFRAMLFEGYQERGIDNEVVVLPCGHYTLGEAPYKFMDGYHIISYFVKKAIELA